MIFANLSIGLAFRREKHHCGRVRIRLLWCYCYVLTHCLCAWGCLTHKGRHRFLCEVWMQHFAEMGRGIRDNSCSTDTLVGGADCVRGTEGCSEVLALHRFCAGPADSGGSDGAPASVARGPPD